jgi:uncharacterized protein (TIGR02246 family)
MRTRSALSLACLLALAGACSGGSSGAATGTPADEQAIRELGNRYAAAYSARDTSLVSAIIAEDYEEVAPTGQHHRGRAEAMAAAAAEFAQMPMSMPMTATTDYVRWLSGTAAVAGGTWKMTTPMPGTPTQGSWMAVAVKQGDDWKVVSSLGSADLTPMMPTMDTTKKP